MGCMCRGRIPRYSLPMAPTNHNISLAFINIVIIILILYWFYRVGQPHYYLFPMNQIQLRHSKAEIVEDLKKEWGKIGSLWLDESDPWIEPDGALQLTHAHFKRHAVKMPDGSLKIPTRVPHPGKKNILMQIREISGEGMNSGTPLPLPRKNPLMGRNLKSRTGSVVSRMDSNWGPLILVKMSWMRWRSLPPWMVAATWSLILMERSISPRKVTCSISCFVPSTWLTTCQSQCCQRSRQLPQRGISGTLRQHCRPKSCQLWTPIPMLKAQRLRLRLAQNLD